LPQRWRVAGRPDGSADGAGAARGHPSAARTDGGIPTGELYVARLRGRPSRGDSSWTVRR
jgi:hypothetical protein